MPKKVLLITGNKPEHFALIDVLMETGVLCAAVLQIDEKDRLPDTPLFSQYKNDNINAIHKFFGVKYSHTSNLPTKPVHYDKINCPETIDFVNCQSPDLLINFDTEILTNTTLKDIKCEKWKIHPGAIEKYKGYNCNFWAFYDRKPEFVCHTIHALSDELGSGNIIHQTKPVFRPEDTVQDMDKRSMRRLVNDMPKLIENYNDNKLLYSPQKETGRFYGENDITENHLRRIYDELKNRYENIDKKV